jgi:hypothetical protein
VEGPARRIPPGKANSPTARKIRSHRRNPAGMRCDATRGDRKGLFHEPRSRSPILAIDLPGFLRRRACRRGSPSFLFPHVNRPPDPGAIRRTRDEDQDKDDPSSAPAVVVGLGMGAGAWDSSREASAAAEAPPGDPARGLRADDGGSLDPRGPLACRCACHRRQERRRVRGISVTDHGVDPASGGLPVVRTGDPGAGDLFSGVTGGLARLPVA